MWYSEASYRNIVWQNVQYLVQRKSDTTGLSNTNIKGVGPMRVKWRNKADGRCFGCSKQRRLEQPFAMRTVKNVLVPAIVRLDV
jgi:hypothetical protein